MVCLSSTRLSVSDTDEDESGVDEDWNLWMDLHAKSPPEKTSLCYFGSEESVIPLEKPTEWSLTKWESNRAIASLRSRLVSKHGEAGTDRSRCQYRTWVSLAY